MRARSSLAVVVVAVQGGIGLLTLVSLASATDALATVRHFHGHSHLTRVLKPRIIAKQALVTTSTTVSSPSGVANLPRSGGTTSGSMIALSSGLMASYLDSSSGLLGLVGLSTVAAFVLVPSTQYKYTYGFSVGYGLSVAAIGLSLWRTFIRTPYTTVPGYLTAATMFYGFRLAVHLFVRERTGYKLAVKISDPPPLKRIPFAASLSIFYAFMTTPILYACKRPIAAAAAGGSLCLNRVAWTGTVLAWAGALLEAVADFHKLSVKSNKNNKIENSNDDGATKTKKKKKVFQGPDSGVYRLTRHPNYTGEVLFWLGTFVAGVPSLGTSVVGWLAGGTGLLGIVFIMRSATKRLEQRHQDNYGGQKRYETWKREVSAPLIPFVKQP